MSLGSIVGKGFEKELFDFKTAGVSTIAGILSRDACTLKALSRGNLRTILNLRANIINNFASVPFSGLKLYNDAANNSKIVATSIEELDEAMDGGFYSGETTAIVRTNVIKNISSSMISRVNSKVTFIDTSDHFEAGQFCNPELICCTKVFDIMEYAEVLEHMRLGSRQCDLIVTDCFTDLIANLVGGISNDDLVIHIKKALRSLKMIAMQHNIAVLIYCRDMELSQRFMLSNLLHALADSVLHTDESFNIKLVLTKSLKYPAGKLITLSPPK